MNELQAVIDFAVKSHTGQIRKGSGLPYIVHPMAVMSQLADWEIGCYNCWKAALCHDILEDCPHVSYNQLVAAIGQEAALIVEELTFRPDHKSDVPLALQKKIYMESFVDKSVASIVLKVGDRVCNTRDFISIDPQYANKYWSKADPLFDAMMTRAEEITAVFGRGTFPRMKYTRTCLNRTLT